MLANKFPSDFLWGVAISGHQTEGNNINSDWYAWEKLNKLESGYFSGVACDFYHCYQEDINLARQLNLNAFRLGIEWSRIEPKQGEFDEKEIEHYKNVLLYLKQKNFKVFLTLWHFTLPQWLADLGGWQNRKSIYYFQRYVEKIADSFGDSIDFWLTLNEPTMYVGAAYLTGVWPPQKTSFLKTIKTFLNLIRAHKKTYKTIHRIIKDAKVGIAQNIVYFHSPLNPLDRQLSWVCNFLYNKLFHSLTRKCHDFLGLNFYYAYLVTNLNLVKKIKRVMVRSFQKKDLKVEIYPRGIFQAIKMFQKYKLPIYITENGIDDSTDEKREEFIEEHLKWLYYGIKNKIDVRGYLYWSLIDNFEWQEGFEPRYGLFEVDYKTQQRKIRPSAKFYAEIARNNGF